MGLLEGIWLSYFANCFAKTFSTSVAASSVAKAWLRARVLVDKNVTVFRDRGARRHAIYIPLALKFLLIRLERNHGNTVVIYLVLTFKARATGKVYNYGRPHQAPLRNPS